MVWKTPNMCTEPQSMRGVVPLKPKHNAEHENTRASTASFGLTLRTVRNLCTVTKASTMPKYMRKQCRDRKIAVKSALEIKKGTNFSFPSQARK